MSREVREVRVEVECGRALSRVHVISLRFGKPVKCRTSPGLSRTFLPRHKDIKLLAQSHLQLLHRLNGGPIISLLYQAISSTSLAIVTPLIIQCKYALTCLIAKPSCNA